MKTGNGPVSEVALNFQCEGTPLLGVLALPAQPLGDVGVLIVVGGPQYRAGAHRQFTLLARHLAACGWPVLRFDVRGMGDSEGEQRSFDSLGDDVRAAMAAFLGAVPGVRRLVLWGLCDGASAALLSLHRTQSRHPATPIAGLCLLNPWVRTAASLARTQVKHYYRERLLSADFWRKLLRGGVAGKAAKDLLDNLRAAKAGPATANACDAQAVGEPQGPFQQRMVLAWQAFGGPILLLLSERDTTAQEFSETSTTDPAWQQALRQRPPETVRLADADHTCSSPAAQRAAEAATAQFLARHFSSAAQATAQASP